MATRKRAIVEDSDADFFWATRSRKRTKGDNLDIPSSSASSSSRSRTRFPQTPATIAATAPVASTSASGWTSSSPSKALRTPLTFPTSTPRKKTPYTPYPPQPSDSPSNPFGRKRTQRLTHSLPPPTSFSKHAALRFQLVRLPPKNGTKAGKSAMSAMAAAHRQGGVYRIARVPLSYTFVHLRCLIAWLFDAPASGAHSEQESQDYLFEVKNKIDIYSPLHKPGQIKIKSGATVAKLSNVRDPARRWKPRYSSGFGGGFGDENTEDEYEDELDEDDGEENAEEDIIMKTDDEDWKWADEEEFTVGHCFPQGLKADTGIIYHHSPTIQIHMTLNKLLLPRQRGISNLPYVFDARGYVPLSSTPQTLKPLPKPLFRKSMLDTLSSSPGPMANRRGKENAKIQLNARFGDHENEKSKAGYKGNGKAKAKRVVKLKSLTPPLRKTSGIKRATRKFKSPPPPRAASHTAMEEDEDLSDADADGEPFEEGDLAGEIDGEMDDEGDLHEMDATHPFFYAQGSSPFRASLKSLKNDEVYEEEQENGEKVEVIYISDSDEEPEKQQEQDDEVIFVSDSSSDSDSPSSQFSSIPYHLREDLNRVVDSDKYNKPAYRFAKYLLEYIDPIGYKNVCEAVRRGELKEEEAFGQLGEKGQPADPFDDDDDEVKAKKGAKGDGKGKEKERRPLKKVEVEKEQSEDEDEEEEEDENMHPSLCVVEDEEQDYEGESDEEEDEIRVRSQDDSQLSTGTGAGSTPSLMTNTSSMSSSSSLPPSSPPALYTSHYNLSATSLPDTLLSSSEIILSEHYPNKKYTFTPAPPRGRGRRLRLERLERRLENAKRGSYLSKYDEKVEVAVRGKQKEEVDELADDD